jgi:phosphoserine phosphatase
MAEKPNLHVFDVDGTILPGDIVERAYWHLVESEIFKPTEDTLRLLQKSAKDKERWEYMSLLIDSYIEQKAGAPRKPIREAAEDIVDQALPEIYP